MADAPFVRLHLRPYRDRGGSLDSLLDAFLRSAAAPADTVCFRRVWESCLSALRTVDEPHFSTAAVDSFGAFVRARGFPAVHHSAPYVASAHPAYRVLTCPEAFRIARLFPETEMRGK